jgi:hypothetical protein
MEGRWYNSHLKNEETEAPRVKINSQPGSFGKKEGRFKFIINGSLAILVEDE